ncbi:MAG: hypothetical protein LBQ74_13895 [Prevotella sp.]|jgi:hypothetical protein|nr:hypothetical protein [Prevotella sp.]
MRNKDLYNFRITMLVLLIVFCSGMQAQEKASQSKINKKQSELLMEQHLQERLNHIQSAISQKESRTLRKSRLNIQQEIEILPNEVIDVGYFDYETSIDVKIYAASHFEFWEYGTVYFQVAHDAEIEIIHTGNDNLYNYGCLFFTQLGRDKHVAYIAMDDVLLDFLTTISIFRTKISFSQRK